MAGPGAGHPGTAAGRAGLDCRAGVAGLGDTRDRRARAVVPSGTRVRMVGPGDARDWRVAVVGLGADHLSMAAGRLAAVSPGMDHLGAASRFGSDCRARAAGPGDVRDCRVRVAGHLGGAGRIGSNCRATAVDPGDARDCREAAVGPGADHPSTAVGRAGSDRRGTAAGRRAMAADPGMDHPGASAGRIGSGRRARAAGPGDARDCRVTVVGRRVVGEDRSGRSRVATPLRGTRQRRRPGRGEQAGEGGHGLCRGPARHAVRPHERGRCELAARHEGT